MIIMHIYGETILKILYTKIPKTLTFFYIDAWKLEY